MTDRIPHPSTTGCRVHGIKRCTICVPMNARPGERPGESAPVSGAAPHYDQAVAQARRESYPADECTACFEAHAPLTPMTVAGVTVYLCPGCVADTRRRGTPPCPCECNAGGFCGGCGHAGCGGRA